MRPPMMAVYYFNVRPLLPSIQPRSQLDYLPPGASLITSTMDHPKKKRPAPLKVHSSIQILSTYPDVFEGISKFPGQPYHIQVDPNVTPKQTPCRLLPVHLKEAFK